jgi:Protein of unknown function (DUF3455)
MIESLIICFTADKRAVKLKPSSSLAGPCGLLTTMSLMHHTSPRNHQGRITVAALSVVTLLLAACAGGPTTTMPYKPNLSVPANLQTTANETLHSVVFARGVQIYSCNAAANGTAAWAFVAPDADLFADAKATAVIGKHGAGPFWQALDGSKVVGQVKARADAPVVGAIPWLLLSTTADNTAGAYQRLTSIQRLNTVGGVAPSTGCGGSDLGKRVSVPYTADYTLWLRKP